MVTATLTRPTTLGATIQCDHKVYLLERIDISHLYPPRERTITLEPISRRHRAKTQAKKLKDSAERKTTKGDSSQHTDRELCDSHTSTSSPSLRAIAEVPQSPAPSDLSLDSHTSNNIGRRSQHGTNTTSRPSHPDSNATSPRPSDLDTSNTAAMTPNRNITVTVASLSGGCLRGDTLAVKVHVNHTKHVKSLHGVIITLYRQARVDMHPSIPVGPIEKGTERKFEDYYPKSISGLGGLSLSGAGSNHVFRKDLSQTIVPLIVDPSSLTANVSGKIHVPDEAFPTISTVPGAMISFRYYIEVVIDIQGKLSSQDRNLGNLGGLASTMNQGGGEPDRERHALNGYVAPVIDTATIRRDKGVVACTFEVVVGTKDTRRKGKKKVEIAPEPELERQHPAEADTHAGAPSHSGNGIRWYDSAAAQAHHQYHYNAYPHAPGYGAYSEYDGYDGYNGHDGHDGYHGSQAAHLPESEYWAPPPVPMPTIEDESQLPEKEQLRRAEARLLPSQPPGFEEAGSSTNGASAPYLPEEQHDGYMQHIEQHHLPFHLQPPAPTSVTYMDGHNASLPRTPDYERRDPHLPSTPAYEEASEAPFSRTLAYDPSRIPLPRTPVYEPAELEAFIATDDKKELQRRQLQMEASAPPPQDAGEPGPAPPHIYEPTAPADDDLYDAETSTVDGCVADAHESHADASASSELPRYER